MAIVSKHNSLQHYTWGHACEGWLLVDTPSLSVQQERMPAQTAEVLHYHSTAQQFFFILQGIATFETEEHFFTIHPGEGFLIEAEKNIE